MRQQQFSSPAKQQKSQICSSYISSNCSSARAAISSQAAADQQLQIFSSCFISKCSNYKQGRRSLAADADNGAKTEWGLVTGQQLQQISRDGEAWQQLQIRYINSLQLYYIVGT